MKQIIYIFVLISSICCYAQNNEPETIQLASSSRYAHELKISDIATQVRYVPLETKDNCLIGNWFQVFFSEEFIFVQSSGVIFQFTPKGKFVRQINKNGQGPGEGYARSFAVDEKNRLIYIYHNFSLDVLVFSMEGKYIKTIRNPFANEQVEHGAMTISFYNGNLLFPFTNDSGRDLYKYAVVGATGKVIHKESNYTKYLLKERILERSLSLISPFFFNNSSCFFKQKYNDTIFSINPDYSCTPKYILKLDKQITLEESLKTGAYVIQYSDLSGKNIVYGVAESETYLDIYHTQSPHDKDNRKHFFSRYNKKSKQLLHNVNQLIVNDWDGGMDIEVGFSKQCGYVMCIPVQPFEMKEKLTSSHFSKAQSKHPEQENALKTLVNNLKEDDNPVLMFIHLK